MQPKNVLPLKIWKKVDRTNLGKSGSWTPITAVLNSDLSV